MPNLVLKRATVGCKGCFYEKQPTCPAQPNEQTILSKDRPCQDELDELIYVEETQCSS